MEEQKQIWSPKIVIGTNMMSETKQAEEIEVNYPCKEWCWESLVKTFFLHTTVKCEMDFQTFPFDNHTCNIEVNLIFFATLKQKIARLSCFQILSFTRKMTKMKHILEI